MKIRGLLMLSLAMMAAMAGFAAFVWSGLPDGARLPIHWNGAGRIDRTAPAAFALAMPIIVSAFVTALFALIPFIEPLQQRMDKSQPLYRMAWLGLLAIMGLVELAVALPAFGINSGVLPVAAVGLFLVALGNVLPKSRPSFFVGIRTPWTLSDPENWVATHRLGGRTMMLGGVMMMAMPVLPEAMRVGWTFAAIAVMVLPPVVYSWWYWHRHGRRADP
jgi:uncharacterized membrane protein